MYLYKGQITQNMSPRGKLICLTKRCILWPCTIFNLHPHYGMFDIVFLEKACPYNKKSFLKLIFISTLYKNKLNAFSPLKNEIASRKQIFKVLCSTFKKTNQFQGLQFFCYIELKTMLNIRCTLEFEQHSAIYLDINCYDLHIYTQQYLESRL